MSLLKKADVPQLQELSAPVAKEYDAVRWVYQQYLDSRIQSLSWQDFQRRFQQFAQKYPKVWMDVRQNRPHITTEDMERWMDEFKPQERSYELEHATYRDPDTSYRDAEQLVLRINQSADASRILAQDPVLAKWVDMVGQSSEMSGHPATRKTVGRLRVDFVDDDWLLVDEVQSDLVNAVSQAKLVIEADSFEDFMANLANDKVRRMAAEKGITAQNFRQAKQRMLQEGYDLEGLEGIKRKLITLFQNWAEYGIASLLELARRHGIKNVAIHTAETIATRDEAVEGEKVHMYYDQLARGFGFKKQQLDVGDLKGKFWVRTASVNKVADDNDPAIDQILNILRHRSDAAAWFVEGGKATRDKLKEPKPKKTAKKPPKYVTNEEGQRIPYPVNWGAFDPSVYSEGYAPPSPTRTDIAMVIQELIKKYDDTPYSINNGYCQEFAEDLVKLVRGAEHFEVGGSWVEENIDEPAHSFVKFEGRYYDAEAPQGVRDWHNLPVFHNLTGKENAYKLHLKKLQEGKFSAAKKASEEDYCMVEGCGIWAVDFARKNGGEICILSADYGEEWSDEIPYEITHAFVKKDGKTFDAGGQRSADEMAKELNVTLYSIKGPWLPDEFEAKFMGDTDDKPLFGKTAAKLYPATDEWVGRAKDFLKEKWAERHKEMRRESEPMGMKGACKFASLFAQALFGGQIRGNADHQLLKTPDRIIDLTDLWDSGTFYHDKGFFGNPEHAESMASCEPRVRQWVEEFGQRYGIDKVAGFGKKADMGRVMQQFPDLGEEIPEAGLIPEKGQYAAIRTSDGQIFADPDWERNTHISFIRRMGIPPDKVEDGGWLIDGVYEPTIRSDAGNYGARARALLNTRKALKAEGKTASKQAGFSKKADTDILVGDGESNAYGNVIPIDELGEWAAMLMPGATRGIAKLTRLLKEHKKIGTLEGIEVSEEKRGQGLGKALLYDFIAEAKKLGATAVVAVVDTAGKQREGFDLIGWYKGQGFKPVPITGAIFPVMVRDLTSKLPKTPTEKARSDSRQTSMLGKPHEDELQDTYAKPKIPFKASLLKE